MKKRRAINRTNRVITAFGAFFQFSKRPISAIIAILTLGFSAGIAYEEMVGIGTWHSYHPSTDKVNICFTPPSGCGSLIANQIAKTKHSIYVQAYGLTAPAIIYQLGEARKRSVNVEVLLDKSHLSNNQAVYTKLKNLGIKVYFDKMPGIAHNKVIILDKHKVITGSFNFTKAADKKNAENVVLIDDVNVANLYLQNWQTRKNASITRQLK